MGPRDRSPRGGSRGWPYPQRSAIEQLGSMDRDDALAFVRQTGDLLMVHKFGVDELMTKLRIWSEEFDYAHEHDPIEHITSRIKRPEAIAAKLARRGLPVDPVSAREHLTDIAGVRVVCPFISDVYLLRDLIRQHQIEIVQTKDYIAAPKPNGYRSLHLIIKVPVHLSDRTELVAVELQLRTIAMDFWAAVEHELLYKSGGEVPESFAAELKAAAEAAAGLDAQMSSLHQRSEGASD
ncbi:GTP pyrophosphokinase [Saccharopolyspora elongata]|uniref:GTP pyrophosphokinase family protein n=1 Tax=Saccharopolyspora elongata TaxID=2530387 RepID=A0A4R4YEI2_9PSEU|nr:GTP pyrophosphokinase family protein [Saccharopolyspora elongata]TDD43161.1 GTP pyrophosphokinase family protein [Saccharopolyspora elongata]